MTFLFGILVVIVVIAVWVAASYNRLTILKNRAKEAWSDIDVQLKRRYDLIPNLVNTVKGYASHESETFEKVIKARNQAMNAQGAAAQGESENMLKDTLKSLFALTENYPELKANENFKHLQEELTDTEDKVQASRRFYNSNVNTLNIKLEVVPSNIIGKLFGFKKMELFEIAEEAQRQAPKVEF
jgi:LemA protein